MTSLAARASSAGLRLHRASVLVAPIPLSIGLGALALRLWRIGQANLWLDEVGSFGLATAPLSTMVANVQGSPHGPLYYVVLKAWIAVFGADPAALRSLSAVAGALVVLGAYWIGDRLCGRRVATLAAVLTALSPVQVYFSREARFHMVAAVLGLASVAGYVLWRERVHATLHPESAHRQAEREGREHALVSWRAATLWLVIPLILAVYAYPLSALLLVAYAADLGLIVWRASPGPARREALGRGAALFAITVVACVPLALQRDAQGAMATQVWRTALGVPLALRDVLFYPVQQMAGANRWPGGVQQAWSDFRGGSTLMEWRHDPLVSLRQSITVPLAMLSVAIALIAAIPGSWRSPKRAIWFAAVIPLAAEAAISIRESLELSRYALFVAPLILVLVAVGLDRLSAGLRWSALIVLLLAMRYGDVEELSATTRDTDYRTVARFLAQRASPGDSVVVAPWYSYTTVSYYVPGLPLTVQQRYRGGWAHGALAGPHRTGAPHWMIIDYRAGDFFKAPADSLQHTEPFARVNVRVVFDSLLEPGIRALRLDETPSP